MNMKMKTKSILASIAVTLSLPIYYGLLPERPVVEQEQRNEQNESEMKRKKEERLEHITQKFHQELFPERQFIKTVSQMYTVPQEAILAVGYVEYVRMQTAQVQDVLHSREGVRTYVKSILTANAIGEWVTKKVMRRSIGYGHVHTDTLEKVREHPLFKTVEHLKGKTEREQQIINAAEVLRLHLQVWEEAGYDIYTYPFKTIQHYDERVALQVTLYNGFGAKGGVPKEDPQLKGTYIPNLQMTFSDLARLYTTRFFSAWQGKERQR